MGELNRTKFVWLLVGFYSSLTFYHLVPGESGQPGQPGSSLASIRCQPSTHLVPGQPGQPGSSLVSIRCQPSVHRVPGEPDFAALAKVEKHEEKLEVEGWFNHIISLRWTSFPFWTSLKYDFVCSRINLISIWLKSIRQIEFD